MQLMMLLTFEGLSIFCSCEFKTASWERAYPSRLDAAWRNIRKASIYSFDKQVYLSLKIWQSADHLGS